MAGAIKDVGRVEILSYLGCELSGNLDCGGLPEVVGDMGYLVKRDPEDIAQLISELSQIQTELQPDVSNRVLNCFSREKRSRLIKKFVI